MTTMSVPTITMPKEEAIRAYRQFRQDCHGNPTEQDQAVMMGLKALSQGKAVIDLFEAMRAAGLDEQRRPKLAITRANWEHVTYWEPWRQRQIVQFGRWPAPRRGRQAVAAELPRAVFDTRVSLSTGFRAVVPYIPPSVRPQVLDGYHILWEAVWEPAPPTDPFLLRHLHGSLYAVLAVWDLTPLERAVMSSSLATQPR